MQAKLCTMRGFQRLRGDASIALSGIIGNCVMALIIGSVFYNLPATTSSFYSRGALLFFAILLNAFSSVLEVCKPIIYLFVLYQYQCLDLDTLCPTTDCREALDLRFLPSVIRSHILHDLRLTQQNSHLHILQSRALLHDEPSTDTVGVLYILPLLLHVCTNNVYVFPIDRFLLSNAGAGNGSGSHSHFGSCNIYRIHSTHPRHAPL